jgi:hypothetical protein
MHQSMASTDSSALRPPTLGYSPRRPRLGLALRVQAAKHDIVLQDAEQLEYGSEYVTKRFARHQVEIVRRRVVLRILPARCPRQATDWEIVAW